MRLWLTFLLRTAPNALPTLKRVIKGLFKRGKTNNVEQKQGKASLAPTATQAEYQDVPQSSAKQPQHAVDSTPVIPAAGAATAILSEQKSSASASGKEPPKESTIAPNTDTVSAVEPHSNVPVAKAPHPSTDTSLPLAKADAADSKPDIATQAPAPIVQPDSAQGTSHMMTWTSRILTETAARKSLNPAGPGTATDGAPSGSHTLKHADATTELTPISPTTIEKQAPDAALADAKDGKKELDEDAEEAPTTVPAVPSSQAPGMSATSGPLEDFMPKEDVE